MVVVVVVVVASFSVNSNAYLIPMLDLHDAKEKTKMALIVQTQ